MGCSAVKVACVLISHLPVQVEQKGDPSLAERPLVIGGRPWDPGVVLDCCPQAVAAGVQPGVRLAQAQVLCPTARFVPSCEENYRGVHDALLAAAGCFSPTVETANLGTVYVEVSGLERLFGPDAQLARQLGRRAADATGLAVQVGLARDKFTAEQAARAARPGGVCVVSPGEEVAFLSPLPLDALPADLEMRRRLKMLGIRSLGGLAALPRPAVVQQFGPYAGPLHDLARGIDPRPVSPDSPPLAVERKRILGTALKERSSLLAHIERMATELAKELARRGYQAEGMRLRLEGESSERGSAGVSVKPPSADVEKLCRLAGRCLEKGMLAEPVAVLTLTTYPLRPVYLGETQLSLFGQGQNSRLDRLREVLRGLRARFGELVIVVAALLGPPPPCQIQVTTGPDGLPRALIRRERIDVVVSIYESWRERRRWWGRPVERDYYRLETAESHVRVIFYDLRGERWLLERRRI